MNVLGIYTYEALFSDKISKYPLLNYRGVSPGFTSILTEIQREKNNLETLVCSQYTNIDKVLKEYKIEKYDLICFTSVTPQIKFIYKIAEKIKNINSKSKIIIGGSYASLVPEEIMNRKFFDAVCIGEGFVTIHLYIKYLNNKLNADRVDGFWIREKNKIIKNKKAPFSDFSKFPIINNYMWDKWVLNKSLHSVVISRGCVNNCSYCSNHRLRSKNEGVYLSYRKIKDIISELRLLKKRHKNISSVQLETESFSLNLPFEYKLLKALEKINRQFKKKISFSLNLHLTAAIKKDIIKFIAALKSANVKSVSIGLESGSYRIRKDVLNRPKYTNADVVNFCKCLRKNNISIGIFVLLGLPTETEKNIKQTISVVRKIKPDILIHNIFYPYPNTNIYDKMVKKGIIKKGVILNGVNERKVARLNYPGLSAETIEKYFRYLDREVKEKRFVFISKMLQNNIKIE